MANKTVTTASSKSGIGIGTVCFIVFVIMKLAKIAPIVSWSWPKIILLSVAIGFIPVVLTLLICLIWLAIMWLIFRIKK